MKIYLLRYIRHWTNNRFKFKSILFIYGSLTFKNHAKATRINALLFLLFFILFFYNLLCSAFSLLKVVIV